MFKFGDFDDIPDFLTTLYQSSLENSQQILNQGVQSEKSNSTNNIDNGEDKTPLPNTNDESSVPTAKSWANLFNKNQNSVAPPQNGTVGHYPPQPFAHEHVVLDPKDQEKKELNLLTASLKEVTNNVLGLDGNTGGLITTRSCLLPRGLVNKGSTCYLNAALQALVHCRPFRALLSFLQPQVGRMKQLGHTSNPTTIPVLQYMFDLLSEFVEWSDYSGVSSKKTNEQQVLCGPSLTPDLTLAHLFGMTDSHEEDCEEFLTRLLTRMNEEMSHALNPVSNNNPSVVNVDSEPTVNVSVVQDHQREGNTSEGDDWSTVGRSGKRQIEINKTEMLETPISRLFCGYTKSVLKSQCEDRRAALDPFFILPLDIDNPQVTSIESALRYLSRHEQVEDYCSPSTGRAALLQQSVCVNTLPPVLVLQLKRFLFTDQGSQKNCKEIDIPDHLIIPKEVLSSDRRYSQIERSYQLDAIIFHIGRRCISGHYTTAIYHPGRGDYLYLNDDKVTSHGPELAGILRHVMTHHHTANLSGSITPYLVIYSRRNVPSPPAVCKKNKQASSVAKKK